MLPPVGPHYPFVHTAPTYSSFGLMPPILGTQFAPFDSSKPQEHDVSSLPGFVVSTQPSSPLFNLLIYLFYPFCSHWALIFSIYIIFILSLSKVYIVCNWRSCFHSFFVIFMNKNVWYTRISLFGVASDYRIWTLNTYSFHVSPTKFPFLKFQACNWLTQQLVISTSMMSFGTTCFVFLSYNLKFELACLFLFVLE